MHVAWFNVACYLCTAIRVMMLTKSKQISRLGADRQRRNIIADYSDYGSQAFAPLTKLGLFPDRCQKKYQVKSHFLNSYRGSTYISLSLHVMFDQGRTVTTWRPGANILKCPPPRKNRHRPNLLSSQLTIFVVIHLAKTAVMVL